MFSTCPFVRPSVCPSVTNLKRYVLKTNEPISVQIDRCLPLGQRHAMVHLGGQEVKGQGHRRPMLDLKAWWRRHSRPLMSR